MDTTASNNIRSLSDDEFMSLVDQISSEIDDGYKEYTNTKLHKKNIPPFVTPINSINDLYTTQAQIGKGVSGSVFLSQSNQTYKQYALKQMLRADTLNHTSFIHEINILNQLNHPNIVHLNDAYISNQCYYITTQYCSGGTLLERIKNVKRFSEKNAAHFIKQILEAIDYVHSKNIVHRDLKLSNIVFENDDIEHCKLKLIDFGQSEIITNIEERDTNIVGSLHFIAPESIEYRQKGDLFASDIWSIGVIAYILVQGTFPFHAKDIFSITKRIITSPLQWMDNVSITDGCKDFIHNLLHKDYRKRWSAKQALEHPWIKEKTKKEIKHDTAQFSEYDLDTLDIDGILAEIDVDICCQINHYI